MYTDAVIRVGEIVYVPEGAIQQICLAVDDLENRERDVYISLSVVASSSTSCKYTVRVIETGI